MNCNINIPVHIIKDNGTFNYYFLSTHSNTDFTYYQQVKDYVMSFNQLDAFAMRLNETQLYIM